MQNSKIRHKYHVHKDNETVMRKIYSVVDENGKSPFGHTGWNMITIIAGFNRKNGCFMSLETMAKEMGGGSLRTLQRYERYLSEQGIISRYKKTENGRTKNIRRINESVRKQILSRSAFHAQLKKQKKQGQKQEQDPQKRPSFFVNRYDNLSYPLRQFVVSTTTNCRPNIETMTLRRELKDLTTVVSLNDQADQPESGSTKGRPSDDQGVGMRRPHCEALRPRVNKKHPQTTKSKRQGEETVSNTSEPEPIKKRKKTPKNQEERRIEAIQKHNKGHVANPLGGPDTRLKRMIPKKAKDIGPTGAVTASQLYRHLVMKYQETHGVSIEKQMPQGRTAIISWFDSLSQKFLETCNYKPTYRDLSEYFEWLLDPRRLKRIIGVTALGGKAAFLRTQQIEGSVYIRSFYDEKLRRKNVDHPQDLNPRVREKQDHIDEYHDICNDIGDAIGSVDGMIIAMVRFGLPLVVQFLNERQGLSELRCRQRIIETMVEFVLNSAEPEDAKENLKDILKASKAKEYLYNKDTIWLDWREKCEKLIDEAIGQYEGHRNAEKD